MSNWKRQVNDDAEHRGPSAGLSGKARCAGYGVTVTVTFSYEKSEPSLATARST
jgi:hypothetical protein